MADIKKIFTQVKDVVNPPDPQQFKINIERLSDDDLNRAAQSRDQVTRVVAENQRARNQKPPYEG